MSVATSRVCIPEEIHAYAYAGDVGVQLMKGVFGMADVNDVAAYILSSLGPMSAMKLQKLVYYSQAWHLVWEERPLFDAPIQAWANGPVVYALYDQHRGRFSLDAWDGDGGRLSEAERSTVDAVLQGYGNLTAHQLSEMTHREAPWQIAREGLPEGSRSTSIISVASMHEYYHGLTEA